MRGRSIIVLLVLGLTIYIGASRRGSMAPPASEEVAQEQLSEADKRSAVSDRIAGNQRAGRVSAVLGRNSFALQGKITGVSDPVGSGGFWSFGFQLDLDGERYAFMCSNYDELYFRVGNRDVDSAAGYRAIQAPGTRVRLVIRNDRRDYVEQCSRWSRCDSGVCPLGILIAPADADDDGSPPR